MGIGSRPPVPCKLAFLNFDHDVDYAIYLDFYSPMQNCISVQLLSHKEPQSTSSASKTLD